MSVQAPLTRVDLNEQAYLTLRRWVLMREVRAGEQLNLRSIAEELGVSRSPVLHALTRLAAEGLVLAEPRRGFFVKPLTVTEVENAHAFRLSLELFAAEQSFPTLTSEELRGVRARMVETVEALQAGPAGQRESYIEAHHEFHRYLVSLCGNPFVVESYDRLAAHITAVRTLVDMGGAEGSEKAAIAAHDEIVAAYERRDVERAKAALRVDLEAGAELAVQVIQAAGGVL